MAQKPDRKFRLGTTSFIFPDHILPNIKKLAPFFDEIELLVFESIPESVIPSKKEIEDLLMISRDQNLTYNVHMPTDISLTADTEFNRQKAADIYLTVLDRFEPLRPTTHTLHLEMPQELKQEISGNGNAEVLLKNWIENTYDGLKKLLAGSVNPDILSIETLDYPFSLIEPIVQEFNLPVCIDLGHAVKYGYNLKSIYNTHTPNIPLMHLHGVDPSFSPAKDHTRLDRMPQTDFSMILDILKTYTGTISLEVFNQDNLNYSLKFLSSFFNLFLTKDDFSP